MPETTLPARPRRARIRALALLTAALAVFGGSIALAPAAVAATGVTVTAPATVTAGDAVAVTITADAGADLFAYDLTVGYDPALLRYTGASETYPTGGFGTVTESPGALRFAHTRLGSSPGLTGAQTLVTFSFTALTSGPATVTLTAATFLDSAGTAQALPAPVAAPVEIAPAATAPPVASPSPSPTTPAPAAAPASPSAGDGASAEPGAAGSLAATGADVTVWIVTAAAAVALLALGVVFVIRRRTAVAP